MKNWKNGIAAVGAVFAASAGVDAAQLSDLQGRAHIPDTALNNCARQALIDHANGGNGMTQDSYQEDGATVYHFETAGPNGEETFLNVIIKGQGKEVNLDTKRGNPTERKNALIEQISKCM